MGPNRLRFFLFWLTFLCISYYEFRILFNARSLTKFYCRPWVLINDRLKSVSHQNLDLYIVWVCCTIKWWLSHILSVFALNIVGWGSEWLISTCYTISTLNEQFCCRPAVCYSFANSSSSIWLICCHPSVQIISIKYYIAYFIQKIFINM